MAPPRVRLAFQLEEQFRSVGLNPDDLITDFQDWKSAGPDHHYVFGTDLLGIGSVYLRHAHMVPFTVVADKAKWDKAWQKHWKRTSDRYLFYADGGPREGYLLIALLDDPGAHAVWQSPMIVRQLEQVAEDFCVFGAVP